MGWGGWRAGKGEGKEPELWSSEALGSNSSCPDPVNSTRSCVLTARDTQHPSKGMVARDCAAVPRGPMAWGRG